MESLNMMPIIMKRDSWQLVVQQLLSNVSIISVPRDTSSSGTFYDYLEEFCTGRVQAKTFEDILVGKPLLQGDFHFFRLKDLIEFLDRKNVSEFKRNKITMLLRDMKAEHDFKVICNKGTNLWKIPAFKKRDNTLIIPELEGENKDGAF